MGKRKETPVVAETEANCKQIEFSFFDHLINEKNSIFCSFIGSIIARLKPASETKQTETLQQ